MFHWVCLRWLMTYLFIYSLFIVDNDDDELFCDMVHRRKAFSLTSSWDHCQRSSPSRISDTPLGGFDPAQNLSSGFVE